MNKPTEGQLKLWLLSALEQMNRHGREYPVKFICYGDLVALIEMALDSQSKGSSE